jgi:hypothetical protein
MGIAKPQQVSSRNTAKCIHWINPLALHTYYLVNPRGGEIIDDT